MVPAWEAFLGEVDGEPVGDPLRARGSTGRPLGTDAFVESLEQRLRCRLKPGKPGPKPREHDHFTGDLLDDLERN